MIKAIQSSLANHNYNNVLKLSEIMNDEYSNYYTGLAYFHLQEFKTAVYYLEKMENHLPSLLVGAKCYFKLNEYMQVEKMCKEYLEIEECGDVWELLGISLKRINRREEAIKSFEKALELEPYLWTSFQELVQLGVEREWPIVKDQVKRKHVIPNARKRMKEGEVVLDFQNLIKKKARGYMLLENLKIKEGIKVLKELELQEESYWVYSLLGKAYYEINEYYDVLSLY